jgi:rod shape-determining protein MreB and related proteins
MLNNIFDKFSRPFAIDLGTYYTLVWDHWANELVLNEPSVVALKRDDEGQEKVIAIGHKAHEMLGKTPRKIRAVRPLANGVIDNFDLTEKMLQHFMRSVYSKPFYKPGPEIVICVPCGSTQVERRAIREAAFGAGARNVFLIEEPMAAAIGAGMPVETPTGSMVVDIGGGTTEVAIVSLCGIVYSQSVRIGGDHFDEHIMNYVRRNFGCLIGEVTAERIKRTIGMAFPSNELLEMSVNGRHVAEGVPRTFNISSNEVLESIQEPLSGIIGAIRNALEQLPPDLASDIKTTGIMLAGGGALLRGIDRLLSEETELPVTIAEDPLTCVVRGGGKVLDMIGSTGREFLATE